MKMVMEVSRVLETAIYLIGIALADPKLLKVYKMYVDGLSPATIASIIGLSRDSVRGLIRRVQEKAGTPRAEIMLKHLLPLLTSIEPIIVDGWCKVCNTYVGTGIAALHHVRTMHRDLVLGVSLQVVEELRKRVVKT
jgi:DNA-binding CsgD family transcriptional regulator